jgi:phosphoglycolate phosphatase-like HAD superfamily hydrolase
MSHPAAVGVSLVTTVFEEVFLGPDLFRRKYGLQPRFITDGVGLLADEKPVVSDESLQLLTSKFGESGLGIVSGRSQLTAEYTLGARLKHFNSNLVIFVEDDISTALKNGELEQAKKIGKPNPYGLLKAEKATSKLGQVLYVGDSKEDLLMVERANQVSDRFIAGGVYGCATSSKDLINLFMENDAYLIVESVNDLYSLFKMIGEGEVG